MNLIGQTDIATIAIIGIVIFAVGAILVHFMSQRR
jgi:hypothetical protein